MRVFVNHENRSDRRQWTHRIKARTKLREQGHEAIAASPKSGVNSITGEGLAEALKGASVVVDVTNSPSWEDAAVMTFFETSTRNLLAYGAAAGVKHHGCVVGRRNGTTARERFLPRKNGSGEPDQSFLDSLHNYPRDAVLRIRQRIADFSTEGNKVRLSTALIQPMAADDVASAVAGSRRRTSEWHR